MRERERESFTPFSSYYYDMKAICIRNWGNRLLAAQDGSFPICTTFEIPISRLAIVPSADIPNSSASQSASCESSTNFFPEKVLTKCLHIGEEFSRPSWGGLLAGLVVRNASQQSPPFKLGRNERKILPRRIEVSKLYEGAQNIS